MNKLETVRAKANSHNKPGNRVMGAVNASFYNLQNRIPVNLIAKDNELVFKGVVHTKNKDTYVNEPIAFGINADGKAMIDHYDITLNYTYNGKTYNITNTNKPRNPNNTILYTSAHYQSTTGTDEDGTEVVFETSGPPKLTFGTQIKGKAVAIREKGDKTPVTIPKNGFVLSGQGNASDRLANIEIGDEVVINVDIDDKWKHAAFMIASGPQLVKNGKVDMTINPNSAVAKAVAARTAVVVDKTGEKVYLITVDGRQSGSPGMSLNQFANYLASLGVDTALNLDGGGSTTMVAQLPGTSSLQVVNSPSDGFERAVTSILMAVDTEPANWIFKDVSYRNTHFDGINWLKDNGIRGYEDGTYRPDLPLKREHAAIMFTNALKYDLPSASEVTSYFDDVDTDYVYADYIAAMGKEGVFKGNKGRFLPLDTMTREQMASTIVNAFGLEESSNHQDIYLGNVDPSHKKSVQILADYGITDQLEDFRPAEPVTRGQFASFLYRASQVK